MAAARRDMNPAYSVWKGHFFGKMDISETACLKSRFNKQGARYQVFAFFIPKRSGGSLIYRVYSGAVEFGYSGQNLKTRAVKK